MFKEQLRDVCIVALRCSLDEKTDVVLQPLRGSAPARVKALRRLKIFKLIDSNIKINDFSLDVSLLLYLVDPIAALDPPKYAR